MAHPEFFRGARVKGPSIEDKPLTIVEASFVMVDVAKRDGLDLAQLLELMIKAWAVHGRVSVTSSSEQGK